MTIAPPIDPDRARVEYEAVEREAFEAERLEMEVEAHAARQQTEEERTSTWGEVDLGDVLAGDLEPEQPTILKRTDGRALLYPGKTHSFVGEFESGKTWAALAAVAETAQAGAQVLYVDFEDSAKTLVRRLVQLNVPAGTIGRFVHYIRPSKSLDVPGAQRAFYAVGAKYEPALVILDGVTEAMALHNWNPNDMTDVARFLDLMPRRWDQTGAAVVMIDHVVKSKDARGRYAIGSQHKMSGVNGASYRFDAVGSLAPGRAGKVNVKVLKDREGTVRAYAGGGDDVGTIHLRPASDRGDGALDISLEPPTFQEQHDQFEEVRTAVLEFLAGQEEPVSQGAIADALPYGVVAIRDAVRSLEDRIELTPGPRGAKLHRLR